MHDIHHLRSGMETEATSASSEVGALENYEQLKFSLVDIIRAASSYARQAEAESLVTQYQDLMSKLAEDRFNLTVVGQFSRGKSTLMNAVMGMERLPTGIVPVTSVITSVGYGSRERVVLYSKDGTLPLEIPLAKLPEYITEKGNPGNQRGIRVAEVQLPAEILRRGFFFVDTPGLGSANLESTATTERFLPEADAIIFVASFEAPFSQEELEIFRRARAMVRKVFFVVNKLDLVSTEQRDQVMDYFRTVIGPDLDRIDSELFPLSAREGLISKLESAADRLARSGLPNFEDALIRFLTARKTQDFLALCCDRVAGVLASQTMPAKDSLLSRLSAIRREVSGESTGGDSSSPRLVVSRAGVNPTLMKTPCFVCAWILNKVFEFFRHYQYELGRNLDEQTALANNRGFCPFHTWQYEKLASPRGVAAAYPKVLTHLAQRLESAANRLGSGLIQEAAEDGVQGLAPECRVCKIAEQAKEASAEVIASRLNSASWKSSPEFPVLCLPHLRVVVPKISEPQQARRLLAHERELLVRVAENMQRYALYHDGLRRQFLTEVEQAAPSWGLMLLAGHRHVLLMEPEADAKKES
jgi:GTP-binding protein EngB required for normal cell division